jgi:hypothetical protein
VAFAQVYTMQAGLRGGDHPTQQPELNLGLLGQLDNKLQPGGGTLQCG